MIRINLLSERKKKPQAASDRGQRSALVAFVALVGAGAAVFLLVHRPMKADLASTQSANQKIEKQNRALKKKTEDFEKIKKALEALEQRKLAIAQLNAAKSTPAWLLDELSRVLTPGEQPTMDERAARRAARDLNRVWNEGWDPKHVWIRSFSEKNGKFTLKGGAQSDSDMTQLALRLQASVYFKDVVPVGGDDAEDRDSGLVYHEFTIDGKVRY